MYLYVYLNFDQMTEVISTIKLLEYCCHLPGKNSIINILTTDNIS